jgi:hypothetical protein
MVKEDSMHGSITAVVLVLAAQLPSAVPSPRDAPSRDSPAAAKGTGVIRGRVTDRDSGQPLARVMVMLVPNPPSEDARSSVRGSAVINRMPGPEEVLSFEMPPITLAAPDQLSIRLKIAPRRQPAHSPDR